MTNPGPECPLCKFPVVPPGGAVAAIACPRCNTWLSLDPGCAGSCLSCHKDVHMEQTACVAEQRQDDRAPVFVD